VKRALVLALMMLTAAGSLAADDAALVSSGVASADPAVRRGAFDAAVGIGPPMVAPLLDMVKSGSAANRHTAEMALARIVANASAPGAMDQAARVRAALLARVESGADNAAADRVCAARLLGIIGQADRGTADALKKAVLSGGPVSSAALEAMQRIPGRPMTDALIEALRRADAAQRAAIVLALGARKDLSVLPVLINLARGASGAVQAAGVRALGMLGSAKAIAVLRKVGTGAPDRLRQAVVDALIAIADARGQDEKSRLEALRAARELAVTDAQKTAVG